MQIQRLITRTLAAAAVATAALAITPLFDAASADSGQYYEAMIFEPPAMGQLTAAAPVEDEVVLNDFTPPPPRAGRDAAAADGFKVASSNSNAGFGASNDFKAGPGCSIQCIKSGVAYARSVGAKLVVKTDTMARIWISVWDNDGYAKMVDSGVGQTMSFGHVFDDLEPGHTYQAMAVAEDGEGYTSYAYGSFVTLNRHVEISLSSANVIQHAFSNSHFSKSVWANGAWLDQYHVDSLDLQGSGLNWGNNVIYLSNVDRYLDFAVQLTEHDEDEDICEATASLTEPALGPGSCIYRAFAMLHDNDLDDRPADATSWTEHTLYRTLTLPDAGGALPPGYGSPLDFTVFVTLNVIYY
jgi:hypothetical protein